MFVSMQPETEYKKKHTLTHTIAALLDLLIEKAMITD